MSSPNFRTNFDPRYGEAVTIAPGIRRITANNPSAFTFHGTNTYLLGEDEVAIIDPGPDDDVHLEAILQATKGQKTSHIILTHSHMDHSALTTKLSNATGAQTWAQGPHKNARELHLGETNMLDAAGDKNFEPDHLVEHGQLIKGKGWALETLLTPGHAMNHACFALKESNYLFSGDHVMGWATSIVAPPDGSMRHYMESLEVLIERKEHVYLPGHGGRLEKAREFTRALRAHRKMRETAVLSRIRAGDQTISQIVAVIYKETDKRLHGAAGLSVFAHIEDLVEKQMISCDGPPSLESKYKPA